AAVDLVEQEDAVRSIVKVTEPEDGFTPTASVELRLSTATLTVELDTSGTVDVAAERKRLEKDLAEANKELDRAAKKLGNEGFLAKAPEHVVAKIRERQQIAVEEVERISARLAELPEK
ncbi:MAG: valine--tRNA ligase, partial [Corynebacterium variabile]|nr:valine--tRNA ligase [Corynebacterium variabile]